VGTVSDLDEVLDEVEDYLEDREDADVIGQPNKAMRLLAALREARKPKGAIID